MGAPIIDVSNPITVDTSPKKAYEYRNDGYHRIKLREISIMWDSNFGLNGKWIIEIRGQKTTVQGQHEWIQPLSSTMGFTLNLSDMNIVLGHDESIEVYAYCTTGTGSIQIAVIGEVIDR